MEILKDIKEILLTMISFWTVAGFLIKVFSGFFVEKIKLKYKNVYWKQSTFEVILKWIGNMIILMYILMFCYYIKDFILNRKSSVFIKSISTPSYNVDLTVIIGFIVAVMICFMILSILISEEIEKLFIDKFENGNKNKVKFKYKLINTLSRVVSCVFMIIFIVAVLGITDISTIFFTGYLAGMGIIIYLFQTGIYGVIKEIEMNNIFIMHLNKDIISCSCFLEYEDYYLVFEDGVERFVKKDEIKEIRKIDVDKIRHDKIKNSIKEIINSLIENTN
ncbi:hypothetical protein [Clostridium sp. UBA5712]|uniref:hypothetical protein n=1 Tax=Clostridium sp. UBA5712 TaxID=1946368 RepID=UPI0032165AA9